MLIFLHLEVSCGLEAETVDSGFMSALVSSYLSRLLNLCAHLGDEDNHTCSGFGDYLVIPCKQIFPWGLD